MRTQEDDGDYVAWPSRAIAYRLRAMVRKRRASLKRNYFALAVSAFAFSAFGMRNNKSSGATAATAKHIT